MTRIELTIDDKLKLLYRSKPLLSVFTFLLFTLFIYKQSVAVEFTDEALEYLRRYVPPLLETLDTPEKKAKEIAEIFSKVRALSGEKTFDEKIRAQLEKDMSAAITANKAINLYLLCFPAKSPNHLDKTLGDIPDLADEIALTRFGMAIAAMNKIYPQTASNQAGVNLHLISDGRIFGSTWWTNGHEEIVDRYLQGLRDLNSNPHVMVRDLDSFYLSPRKTPQEARRDILTRYAESEEDVRANIEGFKTLKADSMVITQQMREKYDPSGTKADKDIAQIYLIEKYANAYKDGEVLAADVRAKFEQEQKKVEETISMEYTKLMETKKLPPTEAKRLGVLKRAQTLGQGERDELAGLSKKQEDLRKFQKEQEIDRDKKIASERVKLLNLWHDSKEKNQKFAEERNALYQGFKIFIGGGRSGIGIPDLPIDHPLRYKKAYDAFMTNKLVTSGAAFNIDDDFKKFVDDLHLTDPYYPYKNAEKTAKDSAISSSQLEKLVSKLAVRDMRLSDALNAGAIKSLQENGFTRLSIRQDLENIKKVRIALLAGDDPPSPWHTAVVLFRDGHYKALKKKEAQDLGYQLACKKMADGSYQPYYFIAESDGRPYILAETTNPIIAQGYKLVSYDSGKNCYYLDECTSIVKEWAEISNLSSKKQCD